MSTPALSRTLAIASALAALAACAEPRPQPTATSSAPTSSVPTSSAPPTLSAAAEPVAQPSVSPPDPGSVELSFTGPLTLEVRGEGVGCDSGFWIASNDVLGPGTQPSWALIDSSSDLRLQLGPFSKARVFSAPNGPGSGVTRGAGEIKLDVELVEKSSGAKVGVKGRVLCPKPVTGAVPEAITKLVAQVSGSPVRAFSTRDFGREQYAGAVSVLAPAASARELVTKLRAQLPSGWVAFLGTSRWYGDEKHEGEVEVVVGPGRATVSTSYESRRPTPSTSACTPRPWSRSCAPTTRSCRSTSGTQRRTRSSSTSRRCPPTSPRSRRTSTPFALTSWTRASGRSSALQRQIGATRALYLWWD
jgi:hypothetical protein